MQLALSHATASVAQQNMSPIQSRMARGALKIGVRELARLAHVGVSVVVRFEAGGSVTLNSVFRMRQALENEGIEFSPDGRGVRFTGKRDT